MSKHLIWEDRWETLNAVIDQVLVKLETTLDAELPRRQTLYWLVRSLQAFAADQFDFFKEGFSDTGTFQLQPSEDYPENFVFRTTLDQVGHDLTVIEQIIQQRQENRVVYLGKQKVSLNERLHQADQLAQLALEPAMKAGIIGKTAVITYFQKSPSIRVLPYASVALIAVPYASIGNDRDLLAIPHEVGHYIYRHGRSLRYDLEQRIPRYPAWRRRWLEEIFSDIYGAMIAGPVLALSFQDLLMGKPVTEFLGDHGDHPVPFLRPYIYHSVLEAMPYDFGKTLQKLAARWKDARATRGMPEGFATEEDHEMIPEAEAKEYLKHAIDVIMNLVQTKMEHAQVEHAPWYCDPYSIKAVEGATFEEKLYTNFEHKVKKLTWTRRQTIELYDLVVQDEAGERVGVTSNVRHGTMLVRNLQTVAVVNGGGNGEAVSYGHDAFFAQQAKQSISRETVGVGKTPSDAAETEGGRPLASKRPLGTTDTWIDHVKLVALGRVTPAPAAHSTQIITASFPAEPSEQNPFLLPPHVWISVLSTAGWNTGGPENVSNLKT